MPEAPRIKICGLREPGHGALAGDLGVWAIGLMFAPRSPRLIDVATARLVARATDPQVARVGVFVGSTPDEIGHIADAVGLTHIQVHGSADVPAIREVTGRPVLKGFGVATTEDLDVVNASDADLVLLDAKVAGEDGGTGHVADWDVIATRRPTRPFLLAGGLTPDNVGEAFARVRPWGVDVSSGVEQTRGVKDSELIAAFVAAVRRAVNDDGSGG
jgi:phosphoribosylanthranilate isomerase